jgi:hypothetical protein
MTSDAAPETNGLENAPATEVAPPHSTRTDDFSLKVKSEFILTERAPSLPPLPAPSNKDEGGGDPRDSRDNDKRNKKRRGQNKKRPRDARPDASEKLCLAIVRGEACPFGEKCRFGHDLKEFMATRPHDIVEVEGGCPSYSNHGYCVFGAMCRVGSNHISKSGENVQKEPKEEEGNESSDKDVSNPTKHSENNVVNILPRDAQLQLRKNKYRKCFKWRQFHDQQKLTIFFCAFCINSIQVQASL